MLFLARTMLKTQTNSDFSSLLVVISFSVSSIQLEEYSVFLFLFLFYIYLQIISCITLNCKVVCSWREKSVRNLWEVLLKAIVYTRFSQRKRKGTFKVIK